MQQFRSGSSIYIFVRFEPRRACILSGMTWSVFFIPGAMFLCTLFIERDVYPSNWPIVVFALIGNFTTTLCFAILYMYTGKLY